MVDILLPDLNRFLELVEENLDITTGEAVSAILVAGYSGSVSTTALYQKMRDLVQTTIEEDVFGQLLPAMRSASYMSPDALLYINEVIELLAWLDCTKR